MNIIIPMAGKGKRLRPHTLTTPKPLIPIAGKPMVHRIVEDILQTANQPVESIAFVIHPSFGEEAETSLLSVAERLGAKGHIFYQREPQGTADAILQAADCLDGPVFIAFADTLFKARFHIDAEKDAIIWTQKVDDPSAFGVVKLNAEGVITEFIEKPKTPISDLAIIGVYYFRDGAYLRSSLQYLLDNNIASNGEFQLTDAMERMKQDGLKFYTGQVEEWLDCGNRDATLYTLERILVLKQEREELIHPGAIIENSTVIHPCFIGEGVVVKESVVGPFVSLEAGTQVRESIISHSLIGQHCAVVNQQLKKSMLGNHCALSGKPDSLSLGDYSLNS